jgi:4-amino-4-deoxy-L-arabinose transferase-like glycosyltransferase
MKRISTAMALIALILVLSALLRGWGLNYDLPYIYHPDEPRYIAIIQNIFKTGDMNPHFFNYPSLFFYINALAYVPYYFAGKLIGIFHVPADILPPVSLAMGVTLARTPTAVLLGRIVTACFGVGAVWLVYLAGRQISGRAAVGMLAALMMAVSPTNVLHSRMITPDTFVAFFSLASFLASILIFRQGKTWHYVMAGICAGFTASSKYNGGLIILPMILAHFLRRGRAALKRPQLYLALLLCAAGFLATTPFSILDSAGFLNDLRYEAHHYSSGHPGEEGNTLEWYLTYMRDTAGGLYLLSAMGIIYGFFVHPRETALLSIFPVAYFLFINGFIVRNDRTFLPIISFLFLLAAWFVVNLFDKIKTMPASSLRNTFFVAAACLAIAAVAQPLSRTVIDAYRLTTANSREAARVWIDSNLLPGSKIAIESYAPFVDPSSFRVQGFGKMIYHDPEWYVEQGFNYLVFSEVMYGRFYEEPGRYSNEVFRYNSLFSRFHPVRAFGKNGNEVRVYQIIPNLNAGK